MALAGFGLDSLIEIGASTVVIWELSGTGRPGERRALRLIGCAFAALAVYLLVQSTVVLAAGYRPGHSAVGIAWTAVTAAVMFALASARPALAGPRQSRAPDRRPGHLGRRDPGHRRPAGLVLNAALGWWWADPAAVYVLVYYAAREVHQIFTGH